MSMHAHLFSAHMLSRDQGDCKLPIMASPYIIPSTYGWHIPRSMRRIRTVRIFTIVARPRHSVDIVNVRGMSPLRSEPIYYTKYHILKPRLKSTPKGKTAQGTEKSVFHRREPMNNNDGGNTGPITY